MIGQRLGHYRIVEKLGEGGMGVVYKAIDIRLSRSVAIKVLRQVPGADPVEQKLRFEREAKAASALNHPNILVIHDIDTAVPDGAKGGHPVDYIVMEYIEGWPLSKLIAGRPLPLGEALGYARQTASALAAAHSAGIVHRDVKPANIMVTGAGHIKVVDFGLAKPLTVTAAGPGDSTATAPITQGVLMIGTLPYMSPEQAEGKPLDVRSDVFSFGAVLYEMLAGARAFTGDSPASILASVMRAQPAGLETIRQDVSPELRGVMDRCLEKDCELRYRSAGEVRDDLALCEAGPAAKGPWSRLRQPAVAIPLAVMVAAGGWLAVRSGRVRQARLQTLPEIARLVAAQKLDPAFRLGKDVEGYISEDAEFLRLKQSYATQLSVKTDPPGAEIRVKGYLATDADWILLGSTPIQNAWAPRAHLRLQVAKAGFDTLDQDSTGGFDLKLVPKGSAPEDMVRVPGGSFQTRGVKVRLDDYWIDIHEVTNRKFKHFADQGGYKKRELWKHTFVRDGSVLTWELAMAALNDSTGRQGPAGWRLGTYPEGQEEFPVSGVSWYEAAAYAEFAGKSLPTLFHWVKAGIGGAALGGGFTGDATLLSNFLGKGPSRVGSFAGLSPYGALDMAGNVREWCWTGNSKAPGAERHIMGGGWNEPAYVFSVHQDQALPFDRSETNGFRCVKYTTPPGAEVTAPIETVPYDYDKHKPVSDEVFSAFRGMFAYPRTEVNAKVERVEDGSPNWRREKATFDAAYGGERLSAHLFLPKNVKPPYQTVIYFPGSSALELASFDINSLERVDYLVRIGRAVVYPVYKAMYDRRQVARAPFANYTELLRENVVLWSKDFSRTIDYLESRPDIDRGKIAFYGYSLGGIWGPVLTSMDGRVKASIQVGGGFNDRPEPVPQLDPFNFAPRAKEPVLMIVGRHDGMRPLECCQMPMYRALGAPAKDKHMVLVDSGHRMFPSEPMIKATLDFLDRYLGPVASAPGAP